MTKVVVFAMLVGSFGLLNSADARCGKGCGCGCTSQATASTAAPAPAVAQNGTNSNRMYSYEPGETNNTATVGSTVRRSSRPAPSMNFRADRKAKGQF